MDVNSSDAYRIAGYAGCGFYQRAVEAAAQAGAAADVVELADRTAFIGYLARPDVAPLLGHHRTSPAVFLLPRGAAVTAATPAASLVGGCDALRERLGSSTSRAPDTSSRDPASVLSHFKKLQREKDFVIWVLWRGVW